MKLYNEYEFVPAGSSKQVIAQPYFLRLYKEKNSFLLYGNGDNIDPVEASFIEEIINKGLISSFKATLGADVFLSQAKRNYLSGCDFCVSEITSAHLAEQLFDRSISHLEKYKNSYAMTRQAISWVDAPAWAKCWVALPESRATFSDKIGKLNRNRDAWVFPKDSQFVEAENMEYAGDWRKLIAVRGDKDSTKIIHKDPLFSEIESKILTFQSSNTNIQFIR